MPDNIFKAQIRRDWTNAIYYGLAESELQIFWAEESPFRRMFNQLNLSSVIELACGHGRHSLFIVKNLTFGSIVLVDVNESNIAVCMERFKDFSNVTCIVNDGSSLSAIENNSATGLFCYDAMVHFEYDDVASYLQEISRVLMNGGKALLHHSNNDLHPGRRYSENEHWRNFMSANLFSHMAQRAMLRVAEQKLLDWGGAKDLDALTLVEKPCT